MTLKVPAGNLVMENAKIQWRNFSGDAKPFNDAGKRNICIMIEQDQADALEAMGWPIKYAKALEEGGPLRPFIKADIKYTPRSQPKIKMITSRGMQTMDADSVFALDYVGIEKVDLVIRPFKWDFGGKEGVKAMLNSLYMTIREDELDRKYADVPEIDAAGNLLAIESSQKNQSPFDGEIEDMGEIPDPESQYALEQGF
jgi:hypothetical protein